MKNSDKILYKEMNVGLTRDYIGFKIKWIYYIRYRERI